MKPAFTIEISDQGARDLDDVVYWFAKHHPDRYARFRSDVVWCLKVLTAFPLYGQPLASRRGLRANPVHPYLVTYRVDKRARKVIVLAIVPIYIDGDADEFDIFSMRSLRRPAEESPAGGR